MATDNPPTQTIPPMVRCGTTYVNGPTRPEEPIHLEPGAVVRVPVLSPYAWGPFDRMIDFDEMNNARLIGGPGATLDMDWPEVSTEWRHAVSMRGTKNAHIQDVIILNSGGDGLYVGPTWNVAGNSTFDEPSEWVAVTEVHVRGSARNAITVASCRRFSSINCTFNGSRRIKSPFGGICIEPGKPVHVLENVHFYNFQALDNIGSGLLINLWRMNETSQPVSMRFKDGVVNSADGHAMQVNLGHEGESNRTCPSGSVLIQNVDFIGNPERYFTIRAAIWCDANPKLTILFRDCRFWGVRDNFSRVTSRTGWHPFVFEDCTVHHADGTKTDAAEQMEEDME